MMIALGSVKNSRLKFPPRRCYEFGVGLDRGALVGAGGLSHFIVAQRVGVIDRPGAYSPVGLSC